MFPIVCARLLSHLRTPHDFAFSTGVVFSCHYRSHTPNPISLRIDPPFGKFENALTCMRFVVYGWFSFVFECEARNVFDILHIECRVTAFWLTAEGRKWRCFSFARSKDYPYVQRLISCPKRPITIPSSSKENEPPCFSGFTYLIGFQPCLCMMLHYLCSSRTVLQLESCRGSRYSQNLDHQEKKKNWIGRYYR